MRIERLDLVRYGAFAGRSVRFGPAPKAGEPDLHIVFGPNEAGKSTLFSAWLDLLFGMSPAYAFDHGEATLEVGAQLDLRGTSATLTRVGPKDLAAGDADAIRTALGALERADYTTMFSLDTEELESGGRAILSSEGRLGELLFSAGSGLSRLGEVLTDIRAEGEAIYKYRGSNNEVARLKAEMTALDRSIQDADLRADEHRALIERRDEARLAYERAETEWIAVRRRVNEADGLLRALTADDERRTALTALEEMGSLPEAAPEWRERMGPIVRRRVQRDERRSILSKELDAATRERDGLVPDPAALALSDRLDHLEEMRGARGVPMVERMGSGLGDLGKLREELADVDRRIALQGEELLGVGSKPPNAPLIARGSVETLRELAEKWSGLHERLGTALGEVDRACRAHDEAVRECDAAADGDDGVFDGESYRSAANAVRSVVRSGAVAAQVEAQRKADAERAAFDAALAAVGIDRKGFDRLAAPSKARVEQWLDREGELRAGARERAEQKRKLVVEREAIAQRRAQSAAPTDQEVRASRSQRDQAWQAHLAALDAKTAAAFESALLADDAVAARRLLAADQIAGLRRDEERLAAIESELLLIDREAAEGADAQSALDGEIEAALEVARQIGLARANADATDALDFHDCYQRLDALRAAEREAVTRLQSREEAATLAIADLAAKLPIDLASDDPGSAINQAEDWLDEARSRQERALAAVQRARERGAELEAREAEAEGCRERIERWAAAWEDALATTFLADDRRAYDYEQNPRVSVVLGLIDGAVAFDGLLESRRSLIARIEAIEADRDAFLLALADLAVTLDNAGAPDAENWRTVLRGLRDRIGTAREVAERAAELDGKRRELEAELAALRGEAEVDEAMLEPIQKALGVESPDEIVALLDRIRERDALREEASRALRRVASALGVPANEAAKTIASADRDALVIERETLGEREAECAAARDEARDAHGAARRALEEIGGDGTAARLVAERQTLAEQLADRAVHALALDLGAEAASRALVRYREAHRSAMMERASNAFRRISRDAFDGLVTLTSDGAETLAARRPDGRIVGVQPPKPVRGKGRSRGEGGLSKGTRHQLYLALRMAGYHEYAAHRTPPPFVCDDVMETFDDERSAATLELLADMATRGQVIVLTHHQHLVDLAARTVPGIRCHDLPGPARAEPPLVMAAE